MQKRVIRRGVIVGLISLGLFVAVALTGGPAQAASGNGPYYAEPAWDQKLAPATRFIVLTDWSSQAVLDRETGLVWEQAPDANPATKRDWPTALSYCINKNVGGRVGWRLPSVVELRSVQDGSPCCGPYVPASVFTGVGVQSDFYWSATTVAADPVRAWLVLFGGGEGVTSNPKVGAGTFGTWCVRGGMNADAY